MFQSNESMCEPGLISGEFYSSIFIINSNTPFFMGEILESDKCNGDTSFFVSNPEELSNFQDECSFESVLCCIPACLSKSGRRELEELLSIERSVILPNGDAQPIYKFKFKNGGEVIYDLADTEYPAEVLVFEPYISYPFIQRNKPH